MDANAQRLVSMVAEPYDVPTGAACPHAGAALHQRKRVLLFAYAFPPLHVPMTPVIFKPMAALSRQGYAVDVLTGPSHLPSLKVDRSLAARVAEDFPVVSRLGASGAPWVHRVLRRYGADPDLMAYLHREALASLLRLDPESYAAIVTWSPFHSVNPVMVALKRQRPRVRWLAQFGDPWARNPLEGRRLIRAWNSWHEPETVAAADRLVYTSRYASDLMLRSAGARARGRVTIIPGCFEPALFPRRPKAHNARVTIRHAGTLFGRRTPEPLFVALSLLLEKRRDLLGRLRLELIGPIEPQMLTSPAAQRLPVALIRHIPQIEYVPSLEELYDADVLVLIEADVKLNLFLASKLPDYIGAGPPIVGLVPPGATDDMLKSVNAWRARPHDIPAIVAALESAIDFSQRPGGAPWYDPEYRESLTASAVAGSFSRLIEGLSP